MCIRDKRELDRVTVCVLLCYFIHNYSLYSESKRRSDPTHSLDGEGEASFSELLGTPEPLCSTQLQRASPLTPHVAYVLRATCRLQRAYLDAQPRPTLGTGGPGRGRAGATTTIGYSDRHRWGRVDYGWIDR